ncbi:DUF4314 domain-containing protein [Trueperella pyogenes]|uniref:DUF4314 domain-containing protein n=1 Tax=Trueperella pyogenes TaxID=1661 RepID=UPI000D52A8C0|nr:DUF4314 domain-containing protein [Trueperella pyogenes]AWG03417.1 DUF4314 domain-containing protein [Trueperella pyogenes]AWG16148.1 DUF4314 domain-containing protein [Trueperella pyogenes]AZR05031.1 DUF4314 domain-containing protein [Trueperella pyogenes]
MVRPGTWIKLTRMSDPYAPVPAGTYGIVTFIDSMGTIHVAWNNGSSLGLIPEIDEFEIVADLAEIKGKPTG